ncbi:protein phosphatase 2C 16 [Rhodamnia argentea]|uniref:protein-serine/threonine phosphatase n=1 Tax=Rhodamnia argentea TaxID=178133 RepID=A0A8B8NSK6_9MYRT|nr:protein phosphatase 2C 16 [Rhodamnia argentea]XP_030525169.1 protein phosphatase 2C 16 [Rhodamnia argentea]XP_048129979.1 protein phosphatase 2C 16 [Rhodamnia argentea]XP_048129980.1 protein phosphatase 2C 16 [Rhodamnia argentea]
MEEMSPAIAVTLSVGNSVRDNSGISSSAEITRLKLVTNAASLLANPSNLVSTESVFCCHVDTADSSYVSNFATDMARDDGGGGANELVMATKSGDNLVPNDNLMQENDEDETEDTSLAIADELLATGRVVIKAVENDQVLAEAMILGNSEVPASELIAAVSSQAEGSDISILKAAAVVSQLPKEKSLVKGGIRSVFELDCIPLWGSVSMRGKRPEMEDAVTTAPQFMKIPMKMLVGEHVIDGIGQSLTHVTSHFFGVYDGHGGSRVAEYCCEWIHPVLAEEIGQVKDNIGNGSVGEARQVMWERAFTNCFQRVDDEIGGKLSRGITSDHGDASAASFEPVAPETVGSTAVVALVCSSHIIVANCGDSRAVLLRGKEAMPLSVDHKPDTEKEYARIDAAGGKVIQWNGYRVFGVLAMSRSIGDRYLKPWIIPQPEVMFVPRAREDECLILASDGLWDVMTNEEACKVARKQILLWHKKNGVPSSPLDRGKGIDPAAQAAAEYLSMLALEKGSKDNISVIVVDLKAQRKFKSKTVMSTTFTHRCQPSKAE